MAQCSQYSKVEPLSGSILACIGFPSIVAILSLGTRFFVEHGGQILCRLRSRTSPRCGHCQWRQSLTLHIFERASWPWHLTRGNMGLQRNWIRSGGGYRFSSTATLVPSWWNAWNESDALVPRKVNCRRHGHFFTVLGGQPAANPDTPADSMTLACTMRQTTSTPLFFHPLQSYAKQGQLKANYKFQVFRAVRLFIAVPRIGQSHGSIRKCAKPCIPAFPMLPEYTGSEMLAMTYGLHDYRPCRSAWPTILKQPTPRGAAFLTPRQPRCDDEGGPLGNRQLAACHAEWAGQRQHSAHRSGKAFTNDPSWPYQYRDYFIGTAWGLAAALARWTWHILLGKAIPLSAMRSPS